MGASLQVPSTSRSRRVRHATANMGLCTSKDGPSGRASRYAADPVDEKEDGMGSDAINIELSGDEPLNCVASTGHPVCIHTSFRCLSSARL